MSDILTYEKRRGELEHYFDRTAADAWARLTSDAPVSGIRATVRRGRDRMRNILLSYLPQDLHGATVLDAGCGTGAFAIEAARRGAHVTAVDLSETLVTLARSRTPAELGSGRVRFLVGDMGEFRGHFDYTIAMDSLIHYPAHDIVGVLERLAAHTRHGVAFTFAPRTALLGAMHAVGRLFPRGDRAPAIEPVGHADLVTRLGTSEALRGWRVRHDELVKSGFYISHAMALGR